MRAATRRRTLPDAVKHAVPALAGTLAAALVLLVLGAHQAHHKLKDLESRLAAEAARFEQDRQQLRLQYSQEADLVSRGVDNFLKERAITRAERLRMEEKLAQADAARRRRLDLARALEESLAGQRHTAGARVLEDPAGIRVRLPSALLFDSASARLSGAGGRLLDEIARMLKPLPCGIRVEGHTDALPLRGASTRYSSNWELAAARAAVATRRLDESGGIPRERLALHAYGPVHAVASNETDEGRSLNRRIELVLTFPGDPPPAEIAERPPAGHANAPSPAREPALPVP